MKVRLDQQEYVVEDDILDYVALKYGQQLLDMDDKLDSTVAFAAKIITKQVVSQLLETFGVDKKLPRGTDPTEFLIRAYTLLMRESLKLMLLDFVVDEETLTIVDMRAHHEDTDALVTEMKPILEKLKEHAGGSNESGKLESDQDRTRPKLVAGREEAQWQDNGREAPGTATLPVVS